MPACMGLHLVVPIPHRSKVQERDAQGHSNYSNPANVLKYYITYIIIILQTTEVSLLWRDVILQGKKTIEKWIEGKHIVVSLQRWSFRKVEQLQLECAAIYIQFLILNLSLTRNLLEIALLRHILTHACPQMKDFALLYITLKFTRWFLRKQKNICFRDHVT